MKNLTSEESQHLKYFLMPNGVYNKHRAKELIINKYYPIIYEKIKDDFRINLYLIINNLNIEDIPTCKNPYCNNLVPLKSIAFGFRKFCCNNCIAQWQKQEKSFGDKISKSLKVNSINNFKNKYPDLNVESADDNNYLIIKNYCEHDDFKIYGNTFSTLYKKNICLCMKCKEELINNYIPSEKDILDFRNIFEDFYKKNKIAFKENWFITYYPKEYKIILYWSKDIVDSCLAEKIYMFRYNLKKRPPCLNSKCTNECHFNHSQMKYTITCGNNACLGVSDAQSSIKDYIKDLIPTIDIIECDRHLKKEIDIYIPSLKLGFEYNGLFYHNEKAFTNKDGIIDKKYHYNKWKLLNDNDIKLITIWEDVWLEKQELIKSIIKNSLGLSDNKIYARKCEIKEIKYNDSKKFLESNHLQGNCPAKINVGLFYENELISLMTFGKKRMILHSKTNIINQFELIRFCSKLNTNVIGGASKLFSYFINTYAPDSVISYANLDISNGDLYEMLGFIKISHTGINYHWSKSGKRYHRSNFMKHKLVKEGFDPNKTEDEIMNERGYSKIWGIGNLKYEWTKNK